MLFKLLPLFILLGVGLRFLAKLAAANAYRKRLKAKQEGRLEQYYADKEAFWRNADRVCIGLIGVAVVWYVVGIAFWFFDA